MCLCSSNSTFFVIVWKKHVQVQKDRNHNCTLWLEWMELKMRESKNLSNEVTLWPQSFLRTSLLYRCLTQSIAIQILININLLISIKIRLPLDQFSLASVWHCRPLITQMTPPPHHSHTHIHTQALDFGVNKADRLCESIDSYQKMPLM